MKTSNKQTILIAGIIIILLIAALVFVLVTKSNVEVTPGGNTSPIPTAPGTSLIIDSDATDYIDKSLSKEEIQEALNQKVAENSIVISMSTKTVFADGKSEGALKILNDQANRYLMVVEIVRKDTEETIYKSNAIPVGSIIEKAKLDVELPKGDYQCVAYFNAYTEDTHQFMGKSGVEIIISVLN